MKVVEGDLVEFALLGEFDVIIHGCNCQCVMGAGIAKTIKSVFPEAYAADVETKKGDRDKLGSYSSATIEKEGKKITIVNAYTQFNWRGRGVKVDYDAIKSVFSKIKQDFPGSRIGYPLIGAGLAGGDWNIIEKIISEKLTGEDHTLVKYVAK